MRTHWETITYIMGPLLIAVGVLCICISFHGAWNEKHKPARSETAPYCYTGHRVMQWVPCEALRNTNRKILRA